MLVTSVSNEFFGRELAYSQRLENPTVRCKGRMLAYSLSLSNIAMKQRAKVAPYLLEVVASFTLRWIIYRTVILSCCPDD